MTATDIEVTVIAPCFNEGPLVRELHDRVMSALDEAGVQGRLLVVDDGSQDETPKVLAELARENPRFAFLCLSRNFGHQAAVSAGLDHADGDAVVVIDGDLQDPPELIPDLLERFREGYDVVYGVRASRKEGVVKRSAYRSFYWLLSSLADVDIPPDSGDFGLMSRRVVDVLRSAPERHRFVRGLRRWAGFRQTALAYDRPARAAGEPKYTFRKLVRLALDGLVSFSTVPLQLATLLGFAVTGVSGAYLVYSIVTRLFFEDTPPGWASIVAVVIGMGGIQLVVLGVIGEYIGRIYGESKNRPVYVVSDAANVPDRAAAELVGLRATRLDSEP